MVLSRALDSTSVSSHTSASPFSFWALSMTPSMNQRALWMVVLATAGLAFKGIFVRFSYELGMTVAAVLMWRIVLATPLYWGVVVWGKNKAPPVGIAVWAKAFMCGNLFTIATVCDFQSLALMDVGVSRAILFTFPLFVQFLGLVHARRVPSARELLAFVICYMGLMLMLKLPGDNTVSVPWLGVLYSLVAAASYGAFLYYGKSLSQALGSARFTATANTSTLVLVLCYGAFFADSADFEFSMMGVSWVFVMVVFATVVPFLLLFEGMTKLGAERSSMIALLGPVISLLAAAVLLGEEVTWGQGVGFVLVITGIAHLQELITWPKAMRWR